MSHIPVNHHLRPLYRVLAGLAGLYVLVFGIVGVSQTGGHGFFAQDGCRAVLGLRANRAFAILSIVAGRWSCWAGLSSDATWTSWVNLVGGIVFLVAGLAMMVVMQTDLNVLGFSMATCVVSFVIGLVLFTAGLYGKVGSACADVRARGSVPPRRSARPAPDPPAHAV